LTEGDGNTQVSHYFLIRWGGTRRALGAIGHFLVPTGGGTGMTLPAEQVQRPAGLTLDSHGYPEVTTAKAE